MYGKNFWFGKEVEGRLLDVETCFIRKEIPKNYIDYPHLYFTIEFIKICCTTNNFREIQNLHDSKIIISIEVTPDIFNNIPKDIFNRCHIIYRISDQNVDKLKMSDTISIDSDWYRVLQITKYNMLELKPDNYKFDRHDS